MPWLSRCSSLLRNWWRRDRQEVDLDSELGSYVDLLAEEKIRRAYLGEEGES